MKYQFFVSLLLLVGFSVVGGFGIQSVAAQQEFPASCGEAPELGSGEYSGDTGNGDPDAIRINVSDTDDLYFGLEGIGDYESVSAFYPDTNDGPEIDIEPNNLVDYWEPNDWSIEGSVITTHKRDRSQISTWRVSVRGTGSLCFFIFNSEGEYTDGDTVNWNLQFTKDEEPDWYEYQIEGRQTVAPKPGEPEIQAVTPTQTRSPTPISQESMNRDTPIPERPESGDQFPVLPVGVLGLVVLAGGVVLFRRSSSGPSESSTTESASASSETAKTPSSMDSDASTAPSSEASSEENSNDRSRESQRKQVKTGLGSSSHERPTQVQISDAAIPDDIPTAPKIEVQYDALTRGQKLGEGGNADVYEATVRSEESEYSVALKEPRFQGTLHAETIDRFRREAETWERLDGDDYVVGIVDWDTEPLPWLALEYMDGGALTERVGTMDLGQAVWTALCVTRGVRHAHEHGIVHHDLKPGNILFRTTDPYTFDVPKVADWGLAKLLLEHSKSVEGLSPQYSAPEQFDADRYGETDKRTDIYQLGAVFYELFTGEPPFEGAGSSVMYDILETDPDPPSDVDPSIPAAVDEVVMNCLAKQKDDRYETIVYLRDDLEQLLGRD